MSTEQELSPVAEGYSTSRRSLLRGLVAGAGMACLPRALFAQQSQADSLGPQMDHSGTAVAAPQAGYYPYKGISGPGFPATAASAQGGWRSGSAGLAYQGAHPPAFKTLPFDGSATGSAVKQGLLPPIRPLIDVQVRDTIVCRGGDGCYYMTGSTGENIWAFNDGIELWKSPNLKDWEYLGLVWSIEHEGGWERGWRTLHDKPSRAIWAPELHFLRGNYYICLSMAPSGTSILKSTTGKAEGPYVHAFSPDAPICDGIDATLFEDTDGAVYFTYGSATHIARLNDDLSGFAGPFREISFVEPDHDPRHHSERCNRRGSNDVGFEGAVLFRAHGTYYLGAADFYEGRYSTCLAMSDHLYGPYRTRHESVPCAGGTGFFQDKHGGWWTSYFGNDDQSPFREKPAIMRVEFAPDGRVRIAPSQKI
jgi:xylan 1,4-beta-xylosidase